MDREAVVSGQFYPEEALELKETIKSFEPKTLAKISAYAVILPHAGYVYSGKVAVTTVSKILPKKRIVILGPNHTGYGENFGLWAKGNWRTPLGKISIDEELSSSILDSGKAIVSDELCHRYEHSIEVELPILQYFLGDFTFVPIACQTADLSKYQEVAAQIFSAVKKNKEDILFVVSSDMTHYEPDLSARKHDRLVLECITGLDAQGLVKVVKKENISMCGIAPAAILLSFVKDVGASKATVALYQTSGDATKDLASVVGYAGVVIS